MGTIDKKGVRKKNESKKAPSVKKGQRKAAIEKMITIWKRQSVDLGEFKFDRDVANAR